MKCSTKGTALRKEAHNAIREKTESDINIFMTRTKGKYNTLETLFEFCPTQWLILR